jgi:hypothetical protein
MDTKKAPSKSLVEFINGIVGRDKRFPTRGAIAKLIGMTDSGFSRAVKKAPNGGLTLLQYHKLAGALHVETAALLRLVGEFDLAEVLDAAHTRPRDGETLRLSPFEKELILRCRNSSALIQDMVFGILDLGADATQAVRTSRTPSAKRLRAHVRAVATLQKRRS